jgi:Hypothetical protein (DUF2513)
MKRDMDLVRSLMLYLEAFPEADLHITEIEMEGYDAETVLGHLILMEEAGFIGMNVQHYSMAEPEFLVHRITWAGHEFLAAARSESIWAKSTKVITSAGIGLAWPLLQAVLRAKAAEHLGIQL